MAIDRVWDELLPDNTTQQISPQDQRDCFDSVADQVDTLTVSSIKAIATDDAGDGTVFDDVNESDFAGSAEPDPAPDTFLHIPTGSITQIAHKGVAYFYMGPSGVDIGLGGTYTTIATDFQASGTSDHAILHNRDAPAQHPTSSITDLDTAQTAQDDRLTALELGQLGDNDRLAALEDLQAYFYTKATNILDIPQEPTWTPVASITETLDAGTYEVGFSVIGSMGDTNDQARVRYRQDGNSWSQFRREAKDIDDTVEWYYAYPKVFTAGSHTFEIEAQKEAGGSEFNIFFADVWFDRKI